MFCILDHARPREQTHGLSVGCEAPIAGYVARESDAARRIAMCG
jgi:hypothetical protein